MDAVRLLSSLPSTSSASSFSSSHAFAGENAALVLPASASRVRPCCCSGSFASLRWPDEAAWFSFRAPGSYRPSVRLPTRLQHLQVRAAKQTFSSFDDLLNNSETPVLVDFYATWCGPCQFMVPVLDDVGRALKEKIRVVKIDSEKYPNIASRYGVQALPTLMLFQDGRPIDRLEGAMPAPELIKRIEGVLSSSKANTRE